MITTTLLALMLAHAGIAEGKLVDHRDQAEGWYVPIHGQVMVNGKKAKNVEFIIYRENREVGKLKGRKKGRFELELDIDQVYTIRVIKEGFQEKLILVDTTIPKDLVNYPDYYCYIEMLPVNVQNIDPFYSDFPSAMIRYDDERGGFYHSENYLTHIQTKLAGYAKVK